MRLAEIRRAAAREDGVTLMELMVGTMISMIVFVGLYTFIDVASSNSQRVTARIEANKLARPVMADIMDKLHSVCVAPNIAPIMAGSTGSSISFAHQTGSAVAPTPVKRTITYSSAGKGTLTESVFRVVSGTSPNWTYSTTPETTPRVMLTPVVAGKVGDPLTTVPVFRYYAYGTNGVISTTPLAVPLSATDAAKTVQVTVSFGVPPRGTVEDDTREGTIYLTDTALFRLSAPGETATAQRLPCG